MSFVLLWRKITGPIRLSILSHLEYRFNLFVEVVLQPLIPCLVELTLWSVIFSSLKTSQFAGKGLSSYLTYVLWGTFFARISVNWLFEFRMIKDIDSGRVNSILVRPISFYNYYLGQFIGHKILTCVLSFAIPLSVSYFFPGTFILSRLPLSLALLFSYAFFTHTLSFIVASCSFYFNRVYSLTTMKNFLLWVLTGELFPLDLIPAPFAQWLTTSPFACGVYLPVGYLSGRVDESMLWKGWIHLIMAALVLGIVAMVMWKRGLKVYAGTGA